MDRVIHAMGFCLSAFLSLVQCFFAVQLNDFPGIIEAHLGLSGVKRFSRSSAHVCIALRAFLCHKVYYGAVTGLFWRQVVCNFEFMDLLQLRVILVIRRGVVDTE